VTRLEIKATIWAASNKAHENNDCTVKALAIATELDDSTVHAAMAAAGRKHRKATKRSNTQKAAKALGFHMEVLDTMYYNGRTAITIERDHYLQSGRYIIGMTRHAAAMVDGKLVDWSQGRRLKVKAVYTLTPMAPAVAKAISIPAHDWLAIPVQTALNL